MRRWSGGAGLRLLLGALLALSLLFLADPAGGRAGGLEPLDLALPLPLTQPATASFAEYRAGHLHSGLDFSTEGQLGWEVRAAADGEIYRLKVERRGYGRAVYVRHAGGYETVYGHLHAFEDDVLGLERFVDEQVRERGDRWPGDLYPDPPRPVRQGQVIALTGETGGGGPHLHFELRHDDEPVDPMRYGRLAPRGFTVPSPQALWIVPRGACRVDGRWGAARLPLSAHGRGYRVDGNPLVEGSFDLMVEALVPGSGKMGLQGLDLQCGGRSLYRADLHRFSFEQSRQVGLIYDVARSRTSPARYTYRLRAEAGLDLPGVEGAWLEEPPQGPLPCVLSMTDATGRRAAAIFTLTLQPAPPYARALPERVQSWELYPRLLLVNGAVALDPLHLPKGAAALPGMPRLLLPDEAGGGLRTAGGVDLRFPEEAFYAPVPVAVAEIPDAPAPEEGLEPVVPAFRLDPPELFLRREAILRAPVPHPESTAFYWYDPFRERWEAMGKEAAEHAIEIGTRGGGMFAAFRDASPPVVQGVKVRADGRLHARRLILPVEEIGEGIEVDGCEVKVDEEIVESEYDPDRLWVQTWLEPDFQGEHRIEASCVDRAGNRSSPYAVKLRVAR